MQIHFWKGLCYIRNPGHGYTLLKIQVYFQFEIMFEPGHVCILLYG